MAILLILRLLLLLTAMALDVTAFFLIVRLVLDFWSPTWLIALDKVGEKAVETSTNYAGKLCSKYGKTHLSLRAQLLAAFIMISIARLLISLVL